MAKVPHFDGRIAVRRLVKRRNPWIVAPFAVKMRLLVHRIAVRLAKIAAIPYPGVSRTNHKSASRFHKSAERRSSAQILQIVAFFLTHTVHVGSGEGRGEEGKGREGREVR